MNAERTDRLRRRPKAVRYFYCAVSHTKLHTGISWSGLDYAVTHNGVTDLFIADIVTEEVIHVTEPVKDFMIRWRVHYNDPEWEYARDVKEKMPVPIID